MQQRHSGPAEQPFTTQDALLAFCLWWAGVPFLDPQRPCFNLYDADILRRLQFSGMTLEDGAKQAHLKKRRGHVEYIFKRPIELPALLKAFHDEEKHISEREGSGRQRKSEIMAMDISEEERAIRDACLQAKMRVQFGKLWENQIPLIRIRSEGKAESIAPGLTQYPGWKIISLGASDRVKKRLGL
jgi:hypothetical protein